MMAALLRRRRRLAPGLIAAATRLKARNGNAIVDRFGNYILDRANADGFSLPLKSLLATGSMEAGSDQLTLTSNPGFQVGDPIIVEIGGETGAGLRGTKGVGGTWPALSYANATAMNADTGQAANTYAWLVDTGNVYQYVSSVWTQQTSYYVAKAIPRSLVTTITAIDGLVLTLAASSTVATTAANVHFDNEAIINGYVQDGVETPINNTVIIPTGDYAISDRIRVLFRNGWTIRGNGMNSSKLFSPKGVPSANIWCTGNTPVNDTFRDFHLQGNARNNGYGLAFGSVNPVVTETSVPQGNGYPRGMLFEVCTNCTARRLKITDVFHMAVGANYGTNIWAYDCEAYLTDGLQSYIQWLFQWADSTGGGFVDCSVDSPYLTAGFEAFRSSGTQMIRPVGRNAAVSVNSSGDFLIEDLNLTIEANSQLSEASWSKNNPLVNINSNIQPADETTSLGGTISNPRIVQEGFINGTDALVSIIINADNPNITITGTYPDGVDPKGYIEAPDYVSGTKYGAAGIITDNAINLIVDGIRIVGTAFAYPNIKASPSGGIARNCVADNIIAETETNNQDNATWLASQ